MSKHRVNDPPKIPRREGPVTDGPALPSVRHSTTSNLLEREIHLILPLIINTHFMIYFVFIFKPPSPLIYFIHFIHSSPGTLSSGIPNHLCQKVTAKTHQMLLIRKLRPKIPVRRPLSERTFSIIRKNSSQLFMPAGRDSRAIPRLSESFHPKVLLVSFAITDGIFLSFAPSPRLLISGTSGNSRVVVPRYEYVLVSSLAHAMPSLPQPQPTLVSIAAARAADGWPLDDIVAVPWLGIRVVS